MAFPSNVTFCGAIKRCVAPGISWCPGVSGGTVISPIVNPVEWIEPWQRYNATAGVILFKCVFMSPIDDRVEWMVFFEQRYVLWRHETLCCSWYFLVSRGVWRDSNLTNRESS